MTRRSKWRAIGAGLVAVGLILAPMGAATATTSTPGGTVNAADVVYWGTHYYYHASSGSAYMTNMNYPQACASGSGSDCNWLQLGLRNGSGTQITQTGYTFYVNGSVPRYFLLPGGSSTIPSGSYAINYKAYWSSTGPFPWTWSGTFTY